MTVIGCATLHLISTAAVEITWQAVCVSERPLRRCVSPEPPIKHVDKYVFLSAVSSLGKWARAHRHADTHAWKKENNRFLKISHPAKKERVGAPPSPARGERDVTALIFSYFLPDPSLVELTKRFEFDSSRRPELSFITVGRDTTFTLPRYRKMYFFFFFFQI